MNDAAVSITHVFVWSMWLLAAGLQLSAWIVALAADEHLGVLLAASSLLPLTGAALGQVRIYILRVCRTIRATPPGSDLRRI